MTHDTDVFFDDADDRHLVDAMDERRRQRARLMAEVNSRYFATARDTELEREVQTLVEGAAVTANGFETERRALFVIARRRGQDPGRRPRDRCHGGVPACGDADDGHVPHRPHRRAEAVHAEDARCGDPQGAGLPADP